MFFINNNMATNLQNRFFRICLHATCLFKNPKDWSFYLKGIIRELFKK